MKNNKIIKYFVGSWEELKKVSWPSKQEVFNHTIIVLVSAVVAVLITSVIDLGLTYLVQYLVEHKG